MNDIQKGSIRNAVDAKRKPIPYWVRMKQRVRWNVRNIGVSWRLRLLAEQGERFSKMVQAHEQAQNDHVFNGKMPEYLYEQGVCDGIRLTMREAASLRRLLKRGKE